MKAYKFKFVGWDIQRLYYLGYLGAHNHIEKPNATDNLFDKSGARQQVTFKCSTVAVWISETGNTSFRFSLDVNRL